LIDTIQNLKSTLDQGRTTDPGSRVSKTQMLHGLSLEIIPDLRRSLLTWYAHHGRQLPWRSTRDPYAIWISEIMLQQTQVKTVIPYYQRWLAELPTIADLAQTDQQSVLKLWQGLGYYARARNLHRAAQQILGDYEGKFPQNLDQVLALPGIGRTTAGGILSAAFDQPIAILDGNVKRVIARLVALAVPPNRALNLLWHLSEILLDPDQPRNFNQALMDLGATVCMARSPLCHDCPWQNACQAHQLQLQTTLPMTESKSPLPHKVIGVAVIWNQAGQVLIDRRPQEGLLGGMWEFPGGKIELGETIEACIQREIQEELAIDVAVGDRLTTVEHAYTHFRITLNVFHCRHLRGTPQPLASDEIRWVNLNQLDQYPFPRANVAIIKALKQLETVPPTFAGI